MIKNFVVRQLLRLQLSAYERVLMLTLGSLVILGAGWSEHHRFLAAPSFTIKQKLSLPPAEVWPWLVEAEKRERWQFGLSSLVPGRGDGRSQGSSTLLIIAFEGNRYETWETIEDSLPDERLQLYRQSSRAFARIAYQLESDGMGGTILTRSQNIDYRMPVARYFDILVAQRDAKRHTRALERLASLLK